MEHIVLLGSQRSCSQPFPWKTPLWHFVCLLLIEEGFHLFIYMYLIDTTLHRLSCKWLVLQWYTNLPGPHEPSNPARKADDNNKWKVCEGWKGATEKPVWRLLWSSVEERQWLILCYWQRMKRLLRRQNSEVIVRSWEGGVRDVSPGFCLKQVSED